MPIYTNRKQILSLPWVYFPDAIPEIPAVYMIRDKSTDAIIYIGQTINLQHRLFPSIHPIFNSSVHNVYAIQLEDNQDRYNLEENCIDILKPSRNIRLGWGSNYPENDRDKAYRDIFNS